MDKERNPKSAVLGGERPMDPQKIKVLLAEDNPGGSTFWKDILSGVVSAHIQVRHVHQLSDVDKYIGENLPDVIILDLTLPDGRGLAVFLGVYNLAPRVPIIVITKKEDPKLAAQVMAEGAQDCLVKSDIDSYLLGRSMRYAIGRQRHLDELRSFSVIDELTGLYNRRGFLTLSEQQVKMAGRTKQPLLLVFADVDGLKAINDQQGHHRGDLALMETAHVLREAFRETDILARLSGDEFAALLACTKQTNAQTALDRFQKTIDEHNSYRGRDFRLSVSIGIALYDPSSPSSIGDLMERADKLMYERKRSKSLK
jgi:two-component system, cell cycle response regulator